MRALPRVTFTLALLATAVPAAHAESRKVGFLCGTTVLTPTIRRPVQHVGEMDGGPLVLVDDADPTIVHTGHLTCSVHIGEENATHAGASVVSVSGPDLPGVAYLPPTPISFPRVRYESYYTCASVTTDEGTWYWDDPNDPTVDGAWVTDPAQAECGMWISSATPSQQPIEGMLLDPVVCPVLQQYFPPEGDIVVDGWWLWDCPNDDEEWS